MAAPIKSTISFAKHPCLLVILGATGTGKSKLAIELATKFRQEIISVDSMQIYKGLDIVTNKVTFAEQQLAPHHLIGFADPLCRFTVTDFRNRALKIIYDLIDKGKMPILVGGTNYYIESLLWKVLIDSENDTSDMLMYERDELQKKMQGVLTSASANTTTNSIEETLLQTAKCGQDGILLSTHKENCSLHRSVDGTPDVTCEHNHTGSKCFDTVHLNSIPFVEDNVNLSRMPSVHSDLYEILENRNVTEDDLNHILSEDLHNLLSKVDPNIAEQLHPCDRRKVIRSLQVFKQHGRPHSEILAEQHALPGGSSLGGPLRFKNLCVLWLQCDQTVLNERLDKRVDQMIKEGLIQELNDFHYAYNHYRLKNNQEADYTKGIFQSIGFKEFHNYLILDDGQHKTGKGEQLLSEGIAAMKQVTKRYSKKQIKWILNRFLTRPDRHVPPVYGLDATDEAKWNENVLNPAIDIVEAFIQGKQPDVPALPVAERSPEIRRTFTCEICQRIFVGSNTWESHLKSRRHAKVKKKLKQLESV